MGQRLVGPGMSVAQPPITLWRRVARWCVYVVFALVLLLVLLYAVFVVAMKVTESRWLVDQPFHEAIDVQSALPHELTLIDGGAHSLAYRLRMIEQAQQTLDLEFFIYELDAASRIVTRALAAKARQGVKVRVLVDFSLAVFELRPVYARELAAAGVQVKYYNTASVVRLFSVQHRTHRKMLVVDGKSAMVGGRNIADPYFDLSPDYNFLDSDVVVSGAVVAAMQESFHLYWDSPWTSAPSVIADYGAPAAPILDARASDAALLQRLASVPMDLPAYTCPTLRFVTDYPGAGLQNRRVYSAITETLAHARSEVLAESPYFVLREEGLAAVHALTEQGVRLKVLTNSLFSTDAYYTVAPLYFSLRELAAPGLSLFAYSGAAPQTTASFTGSERWGVHSKRAVIDDDTIMIGTYNIDPRSANLNSELMLVCTGSTELAAQMRADLQSRMAASELVIDGERVKSERLLGAADWRSLALMGAVAPVASLFDILL
ncbi:MAG: phosphatidylserine/phosphatidylglycerophosphate/cardiolipin synthase family protein [Pseudomonadales bacterium]